MRQPPTGHGGADYAMFDAFFKAIENNMPSPVSLREGLRMTLPGIFANESAKRGGEIVRIFYPWEKLQARFSVIANDSQYGCSFNLVGKNKKT